LIGCLLLLKQVVVPAFPEAAVASGPAAVPDAAAAAHNAAAASTDEEDDADLGNAAGIEAANVLSKVALGEPLWTKLEVGETSLSEPTEVVPLVTTAAATSLGGSQKATGGPDEVGTDEDSRAMSKVALPPQDPEVEEELTFDFKLSSPSAEFFKVSMFGLHVSLRLRLMR
jgi:hypothetical protein